MRHAQTTIHRLRARQLAQSKLRQMYGYAEKYEKVDKLACAYEEAYREYYQIPIQVTYQHGWFYVAGERMRHSDMERGLAMLLSRLQEIESPNLDTGDENEY